MPIINCVVSGSGGGSPAVIDSLSITPSTSSQTITAGGGVDGYSPITVSAVDNTIDEDITAENIVDGVDILGVTGTATVANETTLNVTPSTSSQTLTPSSPYTGFDEVNVSAVDSTIDANISAGNIKSGVNILGVTGNVVELNGSTKTITPTTSNQTVTPTSPSNGFTSVTVNAVTASIDSDIQAGNIKSGVNILGVSGTVVELQGETRTEQLNSSSGNTYTPGTGKNGITSITVTPKNQNQTVTPSTSSQSISVPSGYSGNGSITVNPVTASIDANIVQGNIKNGVTILGVTGNYTGGSAVINSLNVTPSTTAQTITAGGGVDGYSPINVAAVDYTIDANITAGNIKDGVTILGVTGTYTGGSSSRFGITLDNTIGELDANGVLQMPVNTTGDIVFTGLKDIVSFGMPYKFYYNTNLTHSVSFPDLVNLTGVRALWNCFYNTQITSASFPKLKTINADNCFQYAFGNTKLTSISLPKLETITGSQTFAYAFYGITTATSLSLPKLVSITGASAASYAFGYNPGLTSVTFPELTTIDGNTCAQYLFNSCANLTTATFTKLNSIQGSNAFQRVFASCQYIEDIYFPALKTTSFGNTNALYYLLATTSNKCQHNIHFPSNLSSTVSGLSSYPLFGGTSGYVNILFDLPATS